MGAASEFSAGARTIVARVLARLAERHGLTSEAVLSSRAPAATHVEEVTGG